MNSMKNNEGKIEMRKQKGFSLIELLIVVAIILIIAAIAIPNLMRAKMAANESSAAAGNRTIVTGEIAYFAAYPTIGYTLMASLGGAAPCTPLPATACLIDNNLAQDGTPAGSGKSGFLYSNAVQASAGSAVPNQFYSQAVPITGGSTGSKAFCAADDGVVRQSPSGTWAAPGGYAACLLWNPLAN